MVTWSACLAAIRAWAASASGLEVIYEDQNGPRPDTAYIALGFETRNIGQGYRGIRNATTPTPGAEIEHYLRQRKRLEVTLTCYGGAAFGNSAPMGVLETVKDSAAMPTAGNALRAAGWYPAAFTPVTKASGVVGGTIFEPRSIMRAHGFVSTETTEAGTYISTVQVLSNLIPDYTIDVGPSNLSGVLAAGVGFAAAMTVILSGVLDLAGAIAVGVALAAGVAVRRRVTGTIDAGVTLTGDTSVRRRITGTAALTATLAGDVLISRALGGSLDAGITIAGALDVISGSSALLLESGDALLLESGDQILLES